MNFLYKILGLEGYATWTSPIRKYSDMVNHRLIKASLTTQNYQKPSNEILQCLQEARRQNRLVERYIADWLYWLPSRKGSESSSI